MACALQEHVRHNTVVKKDADILTVNMHTVTGAPA